MYRIPSILATSALLAVTVLGTACGSLPAAPPHTPQWSFDAAADAPLARLAAASLPATPQPGINLCVPHTCSCGADGNVRGTPTAYCTNAMPAG